MGRSKTLALVAALACTVVALLLLRSPPSPSSPAVRRVEPVSTGSAAAPEGAERDRSVPMGPETAAALRIGEVRGTVETGAGAEVPGVQGRVIERMGQPPGAAVAVHGRKFVASGILGDAGLEFSAPGYGTVTVPDVCVGDSGVRVVLRPAGSISGEAVAAVGGAPVPGVSVWLGVAGRLSGEEAVTDEAGRFRIAKTAPGQEISVVVGASRARFVLAESDFGGEATFRLPEPR